MELNNHLHVVVFTTISTVRHHVTQRGQMEHTQNFAPHSIQKMFQNEKLKIVHEVVCLK